MFLKKRDNFNKIFIIKGFFIAFFLSSFIYLEYFGINFKLLDTILALIGLYMLLSSSRKTLFASGFFIGIFWCYWMAVSLEYYDLIYLTPILILAISLVYGAIFWFFGLIKHPLFTALAFFAFSYLIPFGFNWVKPELMFIDSYIGTSKEALAFVLVSLVIIITFKRMKILGILPLLFAISLPKGEYIDNPDIKIYTAQMNIPQEFKWKQDYQLTILSKNFKEIHKAIKTNNDLVILPETAFPFVLNKSKVLLNKLKTLSEQIDIYTGALYQENGQYYNATYYISEGEVQIAKKVVLVPFGEEIPLPKYFVDLINDTFYGGAEDYAKASKPTDFDIYNIKFRNAICYEATTDKIYQNLNGVKYVIATSNNAWFTPSIEPTLQNLLLKYYAKKYSVTIFHIVNGSKNMIFRP